MTLHNYTLCSILLSLFIASVIMFGCLPSAAQSFNITVKSGAGRSAHGPKFGERLLPLSRRKNTVSIDIRNLNIVPLNKTTYQVAPQMQQQQQELSTNSVNALIGDSENEVSVVRTRQAKQLNRREDVNGGDGSTVDQPSSTYIVNSTSGASSTAKLAALHVFQADRLIEMSTEFFFVPTTTTSTTLPGSKIAIVDSKKRFNGLNSFFDAPRSGFTDASPRSKTTAGGGNNASNTNAFSETMKPSIVSTQPLISGFFALRKEPWVIPVIVLATLTMVMMGAFEIFVLFKSWRTSPSRRHLFLGQILLLGLFACAGLSAITTAQPTLLSCGTIRFGVGVSYALVFAALLVKCVFLISLNGGVYLPAPYQGLLLLFAVLIQIAIGAQWLLTRPPETYTLSVPIINSSFLVSTIASSTPKTAPVPPDVSSTHATLFYATNADLYVRARATTTVLVPLCTTQFSELLFSLIYIVFLIVFIAVLAVKSRDIRDNYREATYIGLAIGGAIPVWLGWTLCGLAVAEQHKDACTAFGLVATSATVFFVMFMPKCRQLAAMGKEGLCVEDREEQFSSLSRPGSGYSPSFFHFKPIKYDIMSSGRSALQHNLQNPGAKSNGGATNGSNSGGLFMRLDEINSCTTLEPTLSKNPNVFFQRGGSVHPVMMY